MSNSNSKRFQCDFTWTIQNFEEDFGAQDDLISSHFVAANDTVELYLRLYTDDTLSRRITLFIEYDDVEDHGPIFGKFEYSFINSKGQKVYKSLMFFSFHGSESGCIRIKNFPSHVNKLYEMKCINEDQLKIYCRVAYVRGAEVDSFITDQPDPFKENHEMFLNNEEFSDVTLYVGDKKFPCHKIILAMRSSVFKAMLAVDMKENVSNRIDIHDIDENIFLEALRYIYTGKVTILEATAFELLRVADMYDLTNLKKLCENELGTMLTVENAIKILSMSNTYNLEDLKAQTMKFIETNLRKMIDTDAWNDLEPDVMKILLKKFAELILSR